MSVTSMSIVIGQRFRQLDGRDQDQVVTVVRLDQGPMDCPRVVFEAPGGREICVYAAQIDAAVAGGDLTPADDPTGVTVLESRAVEKLAS